MNKELSVILIVLSFTLNSCAPVVIGGAGAAAGITAVQERSAKDAVNDSAIWSKIKNSYFEEDAEKLFGEVSVKVSEGRVMLTGEVDNLTIKLRAEQIAKKVQGVKQVFNDLVVVKAKDNHPVANYSNDSLITTKIRSKMLGDKNIHSVNFSVKTIKGVAYIVGIARSQHELDLVTNIAKNTKDVRKVVTHVRVEGKKEIK